MSCSICYVLLSFDKFCLFWLCFVSLRFVLFRYVQISFAMLCFVSLSFVSFRIRFDVRIFLFYSVARWLAIFCCVLFSFNNFCFVMLCFDLNMWDVCYSVMFR